MGQSSHKLSEKGSVLRSGQEVMPFSRLKWLFVFLILLAAVVANSYYAEIAWPIRLAAGIVLLLVAAALALQTTSGRKSLVFAKGARTELRKVVWPTRQETVQTTLVVVGMVVVAAIILWGVDTVFFRLVAWLTGQRG